MDDIGITQKEIDNAYKSIKIPERRTEYSAGYDIRTPIDFTMPAGTKVVIPTGIKAVFDDDELGTWHLQMYVRSSIGIRDGVVLMNGTGIIDSDYQFGKNDGDMMLALWNTSENTVKYKAGDRFHKTLQVILQLRSSGGIKPSLQLDNSVASIDLLLNV